MKRYVSLIFLSVLLVVGLLVMKHALDGLAGKAHAKKQGPPAAPAVKDLVQAPVDFIASRHIERPGITPQLEAPPDTATVTNRIAAKTAGKDAIKGEYVIGFFNRNDREKFIELARAKGADILGTMDLGNSVRIRVRSPEDFARLVKEGPTPIEYSPNFAVYQPKPPDRIPPEPDRLYRPFGTTALTWLGVPASTASWGDGVKVALLDTGIGRHKGLDERKITRIDVGGGSDTGNEGGSHGTAVASIIAGQSEFARGIAPSTELLSIRVVSGDGEADSFTVAQGIIEAVNRNAAVINICLTSYGDSYILRNAVKYAQERGVVIVAAAGNDGSGDSTYPAAYDGVLGVGAVDATGQRLYFSNFGKSVSLMAPGFGVIAAGTNDTFVSFSGTSASVPFVSGALALLISQNRGMTPSEAVDLVKTYADDGGLPGKDDEFGNGIVDIRRLQDRNTKGINDAAVADVVVISESTNSTTVMVTVQNRGTETLANCWLAVTTMSAQRGFGLQNLKAGNTIGKEIRLFDYDFDQNGVAIIKVMVTINDGVADAYPANNGRRVTIMRAQKNSAASN